MRPRKRELFDPESIIYTYRMDFDKHLRLGIDPTD